MGIYINMVLVVGCYGAITWHGWLPIEWSNPKQCAVFICWCVLILGVQSHTTCVCQLLLTDAFGLFIKCFRLCPDVLCQVID